MTEIPTIAAIAATACITPNHTIGSRPNIAGKSNTSRVCFAHSRSNGSLDIPKKISIATRAISTRLMDTARSPVFSTFVIESQVRRSLFELGVNPVSVIEAATNNPSPIKITPPAMREKPT